MISDPPQPYRTVRSIRTSVIALAAAVALLYYGRDFFVTLIISSVFAFILDPAVLLVMKLRLPRPAATGMVIGVALVAVYLLGAMLWAQMSTISEDLPAYTVRLSDLWGKVNDRLDQAEKSSVDMVVPKSLREHNQQIQEKPQEAIKARRHKAGAGAVPALPTPPPIQEVHVQTDPEPFLATLYSYTSGYFHALVMASFVPFLVYFMLSWRDHLNRSVLRLFHGHDRSVVGKTWSGIGDTTRAYVLGNFFLWLFLSSVSAIVFFLLGLPYWALIGPVSAFFSLVPYIGLPLSILPPVLAAVALPNRFRLIVTLALITAALHLVTTNFLYAKIVGGRVRLNPLIVTLAIMFWGLVWGGIGLILAVPVTAAIKTICDNVEPLEPYGKLLGD